METDMVAQNQVILVVQATLVSFNHESEPATDGDGLKKGVGTPQWFLTYCMLLDDPVLNLSINSYSQFIPLDDDIVSQAIKESAYPESFNNRHLGFSKSIDELMSSRLQLIETETEYGCSWLPQWSGTYETQLIQELSLSLANAYRRKWKECVQIETMS